jgi:hypothetical protein
LADLAGDADKIGRNVEIDRGDVLVTKPELKIARRERGDGRNREVRHRRGRGKAPGPEHFGAEIARKISERIDEIQGFRHRFASSLPRKVQVVAKIDANFQLIVDRRGASPVREEVT